WLELMAKIATKSVLSKQLLGNNVKEDNMNKKLGWTMKQVKALCIAQLKHEFEYIQRTLERSNLLNFKRTTFRPTPTLAVPSAKRARQGVPQDVHAASSQSLDDEDAHAFWRNQDSWRIRSWRLYPRTQCSYFEAYVEAWIGSPKAACWRRFDHGRKVGKDASNSFTAMMVCQKPLGYFSSPMIHVPRARLVINPPGLEHQSRTDPNTLCVRKYYFSDLSSCAGSELGSELTSLTGSELGLASYSNFDDSQAAGFDTHPPMLDRTDYDSWAQQIRLYCKGKENGIYILQSNYHGPFELGTTRDTLGTILEGGVLFGPERPCTYDDLNDNEKKRFDADVRATNIMLQGLPKDIYKLIKHNIEAKDDNAQHSAKLQVCEQHVT
nr:integrase, catalytic region, zinc finger, CCHC-type, peptidase aspartic, catalytic [Tanacetum cinerariifolium]